MHPVPMQLTISSLSLSFPLSLSPLVSALADHQLQLPMAATHSSSSSARGAMSAALVLVLLLAAVASAQAASPVSFENKCTKPVKINGILVAVNAKVILILDLKVAVKLEIFGADGVERSKKFLIPVDATACAIVYDGVYIKVIVTAVKSILGVVGTLLGFICLKFKLLL